METVLAVTLVVYLLICQLIGTIVFGVFVFTAPPEISEAKKVLIRFFWYAMPIVNLYTAYLIIKQYMHNRKAA